MMDIVGYAIIEESGMIVSTYRNDERENAMAEVSRLNENYDSIYALVSVES